MRINVAFIHTMARRQHSKWYKLDNAAKIIPSSARGADTRVFRISCELNDEVDPEILQTALDEVIEDFPLFNCILKKGMFWYYLEDSHMTCKVTPDKLPACSPLYFPGRKNLLYRVCYFHKRINLEMFHVLADGTGAFMFFRKLVTRYLILAHNLPEEIMDVDVSSQWEKQGDAFDHFYEKEAGLKQLKSMSKTKAYQIRAERDENLLPHLVEGTVSAKKFLKLAHDYETTVGILAVALYIQAVLDGMGRRFRNRPIAVSVPVNLRQFFKSDTTRNFFGVININFDPALYDGTLESIIPVVKEKFSSQLTEENIARTMNSYGALEHNVMIKMVPIWIKDIVIDAFNRAAKKGVTTTISNLGQIKMPAEAAPYIDRFSAFMAAPSQQICISSYGDRMVFGEVSPYVTHQEMLNFFRRLIALGVDVEVATNDYDDQSLFHGREKGNAVLSQV